MSDKMTNEAIAAAALAILVRDEAVLGEIAVEDVGDAVPAEMWQERWEHALRESRNLEATHPDQEYRLHRVAERVREFEC